MSILGRRLSALHSQPAVLSQPLAGTVGVRVQQQRFASLFQLQGIDASALHTIADMLGFGAPPKPNYGVAGDAHTLLWNGPEAWLLAARDESALALRERMERIVFDSNATLIDQSHARCVLRVSGACSVQLLASGVPLDIEALRPGASASTLFARFTVHLHCLMPNCFDLYVFRSYGLALFEALQQAAIEYGFEALTES